MNMIFDITHHHTMSPMPLLIFGILYTLLMRINAKSGNIHNDITFHVSFNVIVYLLIRIFTEVSSIELVCWNHPITVSRERPEPRDWQITRSTRAGYAFPDFGRRSSAARSGVGTWVINFVQIFGKDAEWAILRLELDAMYDFSHFSPNVFISDECSHDVDSLPQETMNRHESYNVDPLLINPRPAPPRATRSQGPVVPPKSSNFGPPLLINLEVEWS